MADLHHFPRPKKDKEWGWRETSVFLTFVGFGLAVSVLILAAAYYLWSISNG